MAPKHDEAGFRPEQVLSEQPELIHALAALAGVRIPPASAEAVHGHLLTAARMAQLLHAAPLPDHILDLAPAFTPADAGTGGPSDD